MNKYKNNYDFIIPNKDIDKTLRKDEIFIDKMRNKLIHKSNEIGNQMFMYASAYSI